eukprot:Skav204178  [mRNA]  locus=scaffold903:560068:562362:- [translate_table: standard]
MVASILLLQELKDLQNCCDGPEEDDMGPVMSKAQGTAGRGARAAPLPVRLTPPEPLAAPTAAGGYVAQEGHSMYMSEQYPPL